MNVGRVVDVRTWGAIPCDRYPDKVMYRSADEASCHLRQFATAILARGYSTGGLSAYPCRGNGMPHWHIGRGREW